MSLLGRLQSFIIPLYFFSLVMALIPLGSVQIIPQSMVTILISAVGLLAVVLNSRPTRNASAFAVSLGLFLALSAWILFQTVGFSPVGLHNPVWQDITAWSADSVATISLQPADTLASLSFVTLPFLTFLTGLILCDTNDDRPRLIIAGLGWIGAAAALIGLLQFNLSPTSLLLGEKRAYLDSLTAVFVNRNTAATFLGLAVLICIRRLWSVSGSAFEALSGARSARTTRTSSTQAIIYGLMLCMIITALFLTKSRAGIGSTFVASFLLVAFLALSPSQSKKATFSSDPTSKRKTLIRVLIGLIGLILVFVLFGGRALLRAETQGTEDARFCIFPAITELAKNNWLQGTGFGTFRNAFAPYRDPSCGMGFLWDRAHNFYLEGAVGLGLVSWLVLIFGLGYLIVVLIGGLRKRRQQKSYVALGIASLVLVALHGLVDFSLEIPGMACYFAALLAATVSMAKKPAQSESRSRSKVPA